VQNVETLYNVPHIITHGTDWYRALAKGKDGGTKIYGVSGKVKRPGWWELPMGTTVEELLFDHAGGMREGLRFRGLLPGGASTAFLVEEHLSLPMDFSSIPMSVSRMGTGTMIVLDDRSCPVGLMANLERFFAQESCGWCTPCREGLPWVFRVLEAMEEGRGVPADMEVLSAHPGLLAFGHTFCALAPGAMDPLSSALKYFREDFEQHVNQGRCPWNATLQMHNVKIGAGTF
jgi:NADH-quinone oxidoreductase subunit F